VQAECLDDDLMHVFLFGVVKFPDVGEESIILDLFEFLFRFDFMGK
jgi:hypothetical protein